MAIRAYNKMYVDNARVTLATMLDYAYNFQYENLDIFFAEFIISGFADLFGTGVPSFITGKSGVELYRDVKNALNIESNYSIYNPGFSRSSAYWLGSYLAFTQWYLNRSFRDITFAVSLSEMLSWYNTDHEADLIRFADKVEQRILQANQNLKMIRERNEFSQAQLANLSGVGIRNIQMFEQGKNDISKAQYNTLNSLSRPLNCSVQDFVQVDTLKQSILNEYYKNINDLNTKHYNQMIKINDQYQNDMNRIRNEHFLRQKQIIIRYVDQFPYQKTAYYEDNNYVMNKKEVQENFVNYFNSISETKIGNYQLQEMADLIAKVSGNKKLQFATDSIGLMNAKSLADALYRLMSLIKTVDRK